MNGIWAVEAPVELLQIIPTTERQEALKDIGNDTDVVVFFETLSVFPPWLLPKYKCVTDSRYGGTSVVIIGRC